MMFVLQFVDRQGQDTIWRLARNTSDIYTIHGSIPSKAGSGPRHIAIHGTVVLRLLRWSLTGIKRIDYSFYMRSALP